MNNNKYKYSIFKQKYKFRSNPIYSMFDCPNTTIEKEEEPNNSDEMMNSDNEPQEAVCSDEYRDLLNTFTKLRKGSKRKLEVLIKKNKKTINTLREEEKDELMEFISNKFFGMSIKG